MSTWKLTRKTHSCVKHPCILPIFSEYITITSSEESLKVCQHNLSGLLVIYLLNYDSSESTFFMLNMQLDVLFSRVSFQINGTHSFLARYRMQEHSSFYSMFWYVHFYKNLIVLHHGNNNFLSYLYLIHTSINNLSYEEMTTCHLMCNFLWE